jgi:hypothetical protein
MTMMMNNATSTSLNIACERRNSIVTSSASSIATGNGSLPNKQLAMLPFLQYNNGEPQSHQLTPQESTKAIVASAAMFEQALKESGRSCDPKLAMQWATANHTLSLEIAAREQAEFRGYLYDSHQRDIDREISREQHQETIACLQEEPAWLDEVRDARDRCRGTISTAILRGIALVALTKLVPFLYIVWNQGASFTVVAGEFLAMVSQSRRMVMRSCCHTGIVNTTSIN